MAGIMAGPYITQPHQVKRNIRGRAYTGIVLLEMVDWDTDYGIAEGLRDSLKGAGIDAILTALPEGTACPYRSVVVVNDDHIHSHPNLIMSIMNRFL